LETVNRLIDITMWLNILKVAFGLGFVIFLHELGHFLLAKWNGVKVEKFSIGFGRTLAGFRRGETEYVLAAIPLGGFVKMLGEGPEDQENKSTDPRAYPNKSIGARMAIISAGVIMNLLLGLACFVYAYGRGMDEIPAKVGLVKAGSPAYEAGMRPGDEIVAIDDNSDVSFSHLMLKVRLSSAGQLVHFDVNRPGQKDLIALEIEPRREATAEMPSIGISPASSLDLARPPYEKPPGTPDAPRETLKVLKEDDTLVALGPEGTTPVPVADSEEFHRLLAQWWDQPLTYVFERRGPDSPSRPDQGKKVELTLPPNHFVDFGLRLTIEPIVSIQPGSPADRAGFRKGDRIVNVKVNDSDDFDPMRLPTLCFENAGQTMTFEVMRAEPGQGRGKTVTLTVTPEDAPPWIRPFLPNEPLDVPGLGLAYHVSTHVEAVVPDSPAAKAGIKKGDTINAMTLSPPTDARGRPKGKPEVYEFSEESPDWASAFYELQVLPRQAVKLMVNHSNKLISITPEPDLKWFHPLRGLRFQGLVRHLPPQTASVALRRGFEDTVDNILGIYAMFRSLAQQRVSPKVLGGPQAIATMAYASAASSWTELIHFLGILSINLAVLNFLPIPPLDGGQMAFLLAEKIRGRPLPDSAVIVGSWMGLLLVLCLMVFVIFQDLARSLMG
jgi:regulator of sigma E protease